MSLPVSPSTSNQTPSYLHDLPEACKPDTDPLDEQTCFKKAIYELKFRELINLTNREKKALNNLRNVKNQTLLMKYVKKNGDVNYIKVLLPTEPQSLHHLLNAKDIDGNTALHYAATNRDYTGRWVAFLKDGGINTRNNKGETPLHLALKAGKIDNAMQLISKGADLRLPEDPSNQNSNTINYDCFVISLDFTHSNSLYVRPKESLKSLFKNYPLTAYKLFAKRYLSFDPIELAVKEGNSDMVWFLWQKGAPIPERPTHLIPREDTKKSRSLAKLLFRLGSDFSHQLQPNQNKLYIDFDPETKFYKTLLKLARAGLDDRKQNSYPNFYKALTAESLPKGDYDFKSEPNDRLITSYSALCLSHDFEFQQTLKLTSHATPSQEFVKQNFDHLLSSKANVLIFEADSGAGTTFLLKKYAWDSFQQPYKEGGYKVIYVSLKGEEAWSDILSKALDIRSENTLKEEKILWLLDGYHQIKWQRQHNSDEPSLKNLYIIAKCSEWKNSKFVFTCTPNYCKHRLFYDFGEQPLVARLPQPTKEEVLNLAKSLLEQQDASSLAWSKEQYIEAINNLDPQVFKAVGNPLILKKTIARLPYLLGNSPPPNLPDLAIPDTERPASIEPTTWSLLRGDPKLLDEIASQYNWNNTFEKIGNILHLAIQYGQIGLLEKFLTSYKEQTKTLLNAPNDEGKTPVILAAALGNLPALFLLKENHANLSAKDNEDKTALHWAAKQNHIACVRFLMEAGLDINANDSTGKRPLDYTSHHEIRDVLLHPEYKKSENSLYFPPIHNLILQGDDFSSALEALEELEASGKLKDIKRLSGQGLNALLATFLAFGKSVAVIRQIVESQKFQEIIGRIPDDEQLAKIHQANSILMRLCHFLRQDPETTHLFEYVFSLLGGADRSSLESWIAEQMPNLLTTGELTLIRLDKQLHLTLQRNRKKIDYVKIDPANFTFVSSAVAAAMTSSYLFSAQILHQYHLDSSHQSTKVAGISFPHDSITETFDYDLNNKNERRQLYNLNTLEIRTWNASRKKIYARISALFGQTLQLEASHYNKQRVIAFENEGSHALGRVREVVRSFFENPGQPIFPKGLIEKTKKLRESEAFVSHPFFSQLDKSMQKKLWLQVAEMRKDLNDLAGAQKAEDAANIFRSSI